MPHSPALDETADHVRLVPNERVLLLVAGVVVQADAHILGVASHVDHLFRSIQGTGDRAHEK